jgi:hypothetical protein
MDTQELDLIELDQVSGGTVCSVKNSLDSMSEMGETESLRLQMAMDRVSKFMTALSNICAKATVVDASIVQHMK